MNKRDNIFDFDITKMMDMTKFISDFKLPGVDMDAILNNQRKNIEALTTANKLAFESVQAMMKRQTEVLRQTMQEVAEATQGMTTTASPQDRLAKQTALVKDTFERTVANMRELAEMVAKSNGEVFELLNVRLGQLMEEVRQTVTQQPSK